MARIDALSALNPYLAQIQQINGNQNPSANKRVNEIGPKLPGAVPFGGLTGRTESPVAPQQAQQNYQNGLAPLSNLQNVYAGEYKGKANILNQIGIA